MSVPIGYTKVGTIAYTDKGDWDPYTTYNKYNVVTYDNSSWVCQQDEVTGIAPSSSPTIWHLVARGFQLTYDDVPTAGSSNVVKSGGIYNSLQSLDNKKQDKFSNADVLSQISGITDEVVEDSEDLVTSGGVKEALSNLPSGGVTSFNGRSGSVLPVAGDYTDAQVILASTLHIGGETQTNVQQALEALAENGGGLFPYLYIDSEPGSTVTVVSPDSTVITPTQTGSGHWECEVYSYGVYVIHSVLAGQGDAILSLTVDDVKEYHVTDSHYDFTINVTADVGSTVRIHAGSETYTGTGTGSPVAFVVHQVSTQYTITETLDGFIDTEIVTSASVTGGSVSVTLHVFTATLDISTNSPELASSQISIYKDEGGTPTLVGTTQFVSSSASFVVHEEGDYTLTCTYQGDDYSESVTVSAETTYPVQIDTIPDGSTVLPTDDIQTWLKCAGIDKAYTTLSEVLADHDTLYLLMGSNNAVDYLVRSTTWASGITTDEYAMKYIGKWNYASDTLLNDSTWGQAICDSAYFENVLNAKVPQLTSSTSQNVSSISDLQNFPAYQAFDRDTTTAWIANNGQSSAGQTSNEGWIGYQFTEPIKCMFAEFTGRSDLPVQEYSFKASNDGTTFTEELASGTTLPSQTGVRIPFTNNSKYAYYRMYLKQKNSSSGALVIPRVYELQFYGRQDVIENVIDIYSAAGDTVTITPQSGSAITCVTDSTGHGTVSEALMPAGTYTFTSSIAKDPSNLSNDYTKTVTVTEGTSEVYFMPESPDCMLYWYGNFLGREWSYTGFVNASVNVTGTVENLQNEFKCTAPGANGAFYGTASPVINAVGATKAHIIGLSNFSTKNHSLVFDDNKTLPSPITEPRATFNNLTATTQHLVADISGTSPALSSAMYVYLRNWNTATSAQTTRTNALWFERGN